MSKTVLLAAALLLLPCAARAQRKTDREGDNLRGPVRHVRAEEAAVTFKDGVAVEGPRRAKHHYLFDAEGNYAEHAFYKPDGVLSHTVKFISEHGRRVASEVYNREGRLTRRSVLGYDEAGKLRVVTTYDVRGKLSTRRTYERATDGNSYDMRVHDADGRLTHRQLVTRAQGGTRAEEIYHDGAAVEGRLVWVQNDDGSMREETEYAVDGTVKVVAKYADDLPHSTVYNPDGTVARRTYWTLDERDSHGNWTKRTQWVVEAGAAAAPASVFYRTVVHY